MNTEKTMEDRVQKLFERYERFFRQSLGGDINGEEMAALYTSDFIAATPAGVMTGKNDDEFRQVMVQGYAHYRGIGMKEMRIRHMCFDPMDEYHGVAHVAWTATYARRGQPDTAIDFEVHYFVQQLDGEPKVFGWVSADEQALLREYGIG